MRTDKAEVRTTPSDAKYPPFYKSARLKLCLNDKDETVFAKYHREHSGFLGFHEKCPPSLELYFPVSEELLDIIVVTFVYVERTRQDREDVTDEINQENGKAVLKDAFKSG